MVGLAWRVFDNTGNRGRDSGKAQRVYYYHYYYYYCVVHTDEKKKKPATKEAVPTGVWTRLCHGPTEEGGGRKVWGVERDIPAGDI